LTAKIEIGLVLTAKISLVRNWESLELDDEIENFNARLRNNTFLSNI